MNVLLWNILGVDVLGDRKRRRASWDMGFKGDYMDFQNNKPLQNVISKAYVYVIQTIHKIIKFRTTNPNSFITDLMKVGGGVGAMDLFGGRDSILWAQRLKKNKHKLRGELNEVSPSREEWIESNRYRDNVHLLIAFINDQSLSYRPQ